MAPVTPTLGVVSRVTSVLATVRTWEGSTIVDAFEGLLSALQTEEQRAQLPAAIGESLSTLRLDSERLLLALAIVVEFDLYEAAPGLARLLRDQYGPSVATSAARLASHPGATDDLRILVEMVARTATAETPALSRQVEIAFDPNFRPGSPAERLSVVSMWPGRSDIASGDTPLVAISSGAGSASSSLEFALDVRRAGARVRRLPEAVDRTPPAMWMPAWGSIVADARKEREVWWRDLPHLDVLDSRGSLGPATRRQLLDRINHRLPMRSKLRLASASQAPEIADPLSEIETFLDGAFRTHEMAYLAGISRDTLRRVCRSEPSLRPVEYVGFNYWPFPVLVGLRAWNVVREKTKKRRLPPDLASRFVNMARQEHTIPVAVTARGEVLMQVEEGEYVGEGGQITNEVFFVAGEIRSQFNLGGQRSMPDLLSPTPHTAVNPSLHGGSPTLSGTRLMVEALGACARIARSDGLRGAEVFDFVRARYPEIHDGGLFDEAERLSNALTGTR